MNGHHYLAKLPPTHFLTNHKILSLHNFNFVCFFRWNTKLFDSNFFLSRAWKLIGWVLRSLATILTNFSWRKLKIYCLSLLHFDWKTDHIIRFNFKRIIVYLLAILKLIQLLLLNFNYSFVPHPKFNFILHLGQIFLLEYMSNRWKVDRRRNHLFDLWVFVFSKS